MRSAAATIRVFPATMVIACLTLALGASVALAAGSKALGTFGPWTAYVLAEKSGKMCYVHGEPEKSKGKYKKRDETYIQVTHRPAAKAKNEVGVTAGYTYKPESDVEIDIDGRTFALFTDKDTAWAREKRDETALVNAMKAGRAMIVRGTSSRGTLTTDTYSLKGFTAAYAAIGKACGVK